MHHYAAGCGVNRRVRGGLHRAGLSFSSMLLIYIHERPRTAIGLSHSVEAITGVGLVVAMPTSKLIRAMPSEYA